MKINLENYFDYAAATPVSGTVLDAMMPYFAAKFYNPSALYLSAQDVKQAVIEARGTIASVLEAKPSEIIFTAGGTESDNLAIRGVMEEFPEQKVVFSAVEHDAVIEPASSFRHEIAPVRPNGRVDIEKLAKLIDDETVLVSIMYVNNEIGTIQPIHEVSKIIKSVIEDRKSRSIDLPLYLHTDAAQAPNYLPLLVNSLGVDLMSLNGGKIYGPKQTGILYVKTGTRLKPQILGGGQERGIRSGTENVPGIIGFATALKETAEMRDNEASRLKQIQTEFIKELGRIRPEIAVNGSLERRTPNNIHIKIPNADNERLLMELDELGFMVATGSACSASSEKPSHVLESIGLTESEARSSLRITFGRMTTSESASKLLEAILSVA